MKQIIYKVQFFSVKPLSETFQKDFQLLANPFRETPKASQQRHVLASLGIFAFRQETETQTLILYDPTRGSNEEFEAYRSECQMCLTSTSCTIREMPLREYEGFKVSYADLQKHGDMLIPAWIEINSKILIISASPVALTYKELGMNYDKAETAGTIKEYEDVFDVPPQEGP